MVAAGSLALAGQAGFGHLLREALIQLVDWLVKFFADRLCQTRQLKSTTCALWTRRNLQLLTCSSFLMRDALDEVLALCCSLSSSLAQSF